MVGEQEEVVDVDDANWNDSNLDASLPPCQINFSRPYSNVSELALAPNGSILGMINGNSAGFLLGTYARSIAMGSLPVAQLCKMPPKYLVNVTVESSVRDGTTGLSIILPNK